MLWLSVSSSAQRWRDRSPLRSFVGDVVIAAADRTLQSAGRLLDLAITTEAAEAARCQQLAQPWQSSQLDRTPTLRHQWPSPSSLRGQAIKPPQQARRSCRAVQFASAGVPRALTEDRLQKLAEQSRRSSGGTSKRGPGGLDTRTTPPRAAAVSHFCAGTLPMALRHTACPGAPRVRPRVMRTGRGLQHGAGLSLDHLQVAPQPGISPPQMLRNQFRSAARSRSAFSWRGDASVQAGCHPLRYYRNELRQAMPRPDVSMAGPAISSSR